MSHERSITVGFDDGYYNISTKDKHPSHRTLSNAEAIRLFKSTGKSLSGPFKTEEEALKAAKERSRSFDEDIQMADKLAETDKAFREKQKSINLRALNAEKSSPGGKVSQNIINQLVAEYAMNKMQQGAFESEFGVTEQEALRREPLFILQDIMRQSNPQAAMRDQMNRLAPDPNDRMDISPRPQSNLPRPQNINDGPVPGQSLTETPGNAKWEHPPQYSDPRKAAEMVWRQLTKPENSKRLIGLLKLGTPVEALVRTTLFAGFSEGKWTVDTGMLIARPIAAMITALGKAANIPMKLRMPGAETDKELVNMAILKNSKDSEIPLEDKKQQFLGLLNKELI